MILMSLHSLMNRKGYRHFQGYHNSYDNDIYYTFSTLNNNRGNLIDVRIGEYDYDIVAWFDDCDYNFNYSNISESLLLSLIEERC